MKKIITFLLVFVMGLACLSFTACGDSARDLDDILKDGKLTVATNAEFAPFEYKEGENYLGIDIEIAEIIAESLGVELVINNMDFDSVVTSVQKGQSDLALAALTISEDRKKAIDFSDAYFGAKQYLIVKADDTTFDACVTADDVVAKLATLSGKAAAQSGTTGYWYIKGSEDFGFPGVANLDAVSYDTPALAATAVVNGQAKVAVVDDEVANQIVNANSAVKAIKISLSSEEYGIGVNKSNTALMWVVNNVLSGLKQSGTLAQIIASYTATPAE